MTFCKTIVSPMTGNKLYLSKYGCYFFYFVLLLFFSFFDTYISIGGFTVKLFYLFAIPSLLHSLFIVLAKKVEHIDILVVLWICSSFLAFGHIISLSDMITCVIGEIVLLLIFVDFQYFCQKYSITHRQIIRFLKICFALFGFIGIFQFLLYVILGVEFGISHVSSLGFPRPRSVFLEPDWFGFYMMFGSLLFLLEIIKTKKANNIKDIAGFFICLVSLLLSMARAAWVGFGVSVIASFFVLNQKAKRRLVKLVICCIVFALLVLLFMSACNTRYFASFLRRLDFLSWSKNDGGAFDTRSYSISIMIQFIQQHPFTGNGSGSMNYISSNSQLLFSLGYYYEINAGRGNANLILATLFDVGIIGFIPFLGILLELLRKSFNLCKLEKKNVLYVFVFASFIGMLVDFQFNNGIRFASVWLLFGLINWLFNSRKRKRIHF